MCNEYYCTKEWQWLYTVIPMFPIPIGKVYNVFSRENWKIYSNLRKDNALKLIFMNITLLHTLLLPKGKKDERIILCCVTHTV